PSKVRPMAGGFGQFCPVAMACEVFAERWTPIILRELFAGSHRFNEIHRCIPLISRALLARRLRELEAAGVITSSAGGAGRGRDYRLNAAGREFRAALDALGAWGQRWTVRVQPKNLDPGLLIWNIRRRIALERLPARRVLAQVSFTGVPPACRGARDYWLVLERSGVDVCLKDPGHEVDVYVEADLAAMARVWLGDQTFGAAVRERKIRVSGSPALARQFPSWLLLSPFAAVPHPGRPSAEGRRFASPR
ncbi:MAG TPA: helix-turn-helix domain-containing protein, partial [Burkholderiales bacterium]|nr:helix-turn-helix domain-containing protein [Burkholderiales bacterium]